MMDEGLNLMIIAGEVSGDILGGELSAELMQLDNKIKLFGIGGEKMKQAGVEIIYHINKLAFLGFAEVEKN
jgi:lipid-A-disaccharide synthase